MSNVEGFGSIDTAEALEPDWAAVMAPGGTPDADRMHYLAQVAAGASRLDDAQLVFGAQLSSIEQALNPASRAHDRLYVRIGVAVTAPGGKLTGHLSGVGLEAQGSLDGGSVGVLQELGFTAERSLQPGAGAPLDLLSLSGQNVAVSWVSVRTEKPFFDETTGTAYEIVAAPAGLDW